MRKQLGWGNAQFLTNSSDLVPLFQIAFHER
ncbi:hypothetical protein JMJ77_0001071 [Colletotrichum scovillei]|uniref:Uncharacterized protein n=1 Tax=Colletotrichum scovillei TaxID=1209932 RepID=A0A9P7UKK3_9PEZI|nr:hypothetical protein JMJ77_0001071 [Colletotrichum scovillei]KAG7072296.1 hypothetical protein JMJ76_0005152 [Colletotrichum scovillei]KAG7080501.1 hypothetical protein JMJ78_0007595 [Colletotrichum scovillei]